MDYLLAIVWVGAVLVLICWQIKNNMTLKLELKQVREMRLRKIKIEKLEKPVQTIESESVRETEKVLQEAIKGCAQVMRSEIKGEPLYEFAAEQSKALQAYIQALNAMEQSINCLENMVLRYEKTIARLGMELNEKAMNDD